MSTATNAKRKLNPLVVRRRTQEVLVRIARALFLIGLCYLFLFPIFYLFLMALSSEESLYNPNVVWLPAEITMENITAAVSKLQLLPEAGQSFLNTPVMLSLTNAVLGTLASLVSCSIIGYGFARYNFFEKKIAFMLVILTIIIPPQTMLITQFLQYKDFTFAGILSLLGLPSINLLNTSWTFILPALFGCGLRNGLFIFIFRQFFLGLPKDLEEAAWIDGCNPLRTFIRVIIPNSTSSIITVTLFSFVWHWNDYYYSTMLYTDKVKPLIAQMESIKYSLQVLMNDGGNKGALSARGVLASCGLLTLIVPLVLYIFLQRFFVESIERTGIVG